MLFSAWGSFPDGNSKYIIAYLKRDSTWSKLVGGFTTSQYSFYDSGDEDKVEKDEQVTWIPALNSWVSDKVSSRIDRCSRVVQPVQWMLCKHLTSNNWCHSARLIKKKTNNFLALFPRRLLAKCAKSIQFQYGMSNILLSPLMPAINTPTRVFKGANISSAPWVRRIFLFLNAGDYVSFPLQNIFVVHVPLLIVIMHIIYQKQCS